MANYRQFSSLRKVLDTDFAQLATQDLIGGGTFSVGGYDWTTQNEANAGTFGVVNGSGLRIYNNTTSSTFTRASAATAPGLLLPSIQTLFASDPASVASIMVRVHLDVSSAAALTETAGFCLVDTDSTLFGVAGSVGHDGTNPIHKAVKDATASTSTIPAAHAGADAQIMGRYWPGSMNTRTADAAAGIVAWASMTVRDRISVNGNAAPGELGLETNLHIFSEAQNVAGTFETTFKRLEMWFIEHPTP